MVKLYVSMAGKKERKKERKKRTKKEQKKKTSVARGGAWGARRSRGRALALALALAHTLRADPVSPPPAAASVIRRRTTSRIHNMGCRRWIPSLLTAIVVVLSPQLIVESSAMSMPSVRYPPRFAIVLAARPWGSAVVNVNGGNMLEGLAREQCN